MLTIPKTHDLRSTVADIRSLLGDDHVHLALIVAPDGRLVTTIERSDIDAGIPGSALARHFGTMEGRTVDPAQLLADVQLDLRRSGTRRVAVVDPSGRLIGLLCVKRDGTGYCSDDGVRRRASGLPRPSGRPGGYEPEAGSAP